jgi:hypothetical protein
MLSWLHSTLRELWFSLMQTHVAGVCIQVQAHRHHNPHLRSHHRRHHHQIVVHSSIGLVDSHHHQRRRHYRFQDLLTSLEQWPTLASQLLLVDYSNLALLSICVVRAFASHQQPGLHSCWNRSETLIHQQHQVSTPLYLVQQLMSEWTAIDPLVSRPSGCAAQLKVVPLCCSRPIVAGEPSRRCCPANADEAPLVRSNQLATVVLGCWPIRTPRLRTQGHQRTSKIDLRYCDAKVFGCVAVVYCAANLRGLARSFAHVWATASLFHVSTSVLVH